MQTISGASLYTLKLNGTLKRISDNLILDYNGQEEVESDKNKVSKPHLSPIVDLTKPEQLHGLAERISAVESLIFLSKQYEYLQGYLEHLLPANNKIILQQFFSQVSCEFCIFQQP